MLRLQAVRHAAFGPNPGAPPSPELVVLFGERCAAYQLDLLPPATTPGNRNGLSAMAAALLPELTGGAHPDLVVLAHATPDCDPGTSIAGYLQQRIPGDPLVLALTEQGRTTPFAALRAAAALAAEGHERVAVLALDQATVPYPDPVLDRLDRSADHAVGLWFTTDPDDDPDGDTGGDTAAVPAGPGRAWLRSVRELTEVPPERVAVTLAGAFAGVGPDVVVCGPAVPVPPGPYRVRRAPAGRLCTAVWAELAAELGTEPATGPAGAAAPRTVAVVEHEAELHYVGLAVLDVDGRTGR